MPEILVLDVDIVITYQSYLNTQSLGMCIGWLPSYFTITLMVHCHTTIRIMCWIIFSTQKPVFTPQIC